MTRSQEPNAPHAANAPAGTRGPQASNDDVMGVLSEFEQGLESLKKLYGERKAILNALEARESELAQRELDIARRELDAQARREEAERLQQQVAELARTLQERENGLREQRELLDRAQNEAKKRTEELEALDKSIAERAAAQAAEAQRTVAGLDGKLAELRKAGEDLASQRQQAEADRAKLATMMEELPKREAQLATQQGELEREKQQLGAARAELAKAHESLRAEQQAAKQAESQDVARLSALLEKAEASAGEMGKRAETAATQAEAAARRAAELERELASLQAQVQQQTASRGGELAEVKSRLEQLDKQLKEALAERDSAGSRAQQAEQRAQQSEAKAKEAAAALAAATAAAQQSGTQHTQSEQALREQIEQTRTDLAELEKVLDQLRERLQSEAARADDAAKRVTELEAIMTSPGGSESALRIECDRLQEELAQARQQLAHKPTPASKAGTTLAHGTDAAWVTVRRKRLSRGRTLLMEQTRKIRRAGEVLHKRFEQCEQILAQRAELALAKRAIDQATKKAAQRESKAKAGSLVFFAVFTISILGALSWFAAGQFFPGEFASIATIAADGKGRELTADELKEWQTFHAAMIEDPRFMEAAADRMNQRGITSLAQAGAVGQLVKSSMSASSSADGQLTLELRGDGPAKTQRVLDTFTIALASQANAARERRIDGGVTVIKDAASLPSSPLDHQRAVYAAILWAGSSLLALIIGLVIWKQLSAAKSRFEQSNQVEAVLDESRWPTLQG